MFSVIACDGAQGYRGPFQVGQVDTWLSAVWPFPDGAFLHLH